MTTQLRAVDYKVTLSQLDLVLFIIYFNLIVFENRRFYNNPHQFFSSVLFDTLKKFRTVST